MAVEGTKSAMTLSGKETSELGPAAPAKAVPALAELEDPALASLSSCA